LDKSQQDAAVAATQANYDSTMNDPAASEVAKQAADSELFRGDRRYDRTRGRHDGLRG
jgi:hypothetical protein